MNRKKVLDELVAYCQGKLQSGVKPDLLFICTHNSRRSHFSQIWTEVAAYYYGFEIDTYSGGTAVTAFNERAVAALSRAGLEMLNPGGENPRYLVQYSEQVSPITAFSKLYNDPYNPSKDFCAVMTCSSADADCPVVLGAESRIALLYVDPKESDGTTAEIATYDERCFQIATEMFYVWREVKQAFTSA